MCKILNMMVFLSTALDAKYMLMKLMKEYNHIGGYSMYDYSPGCQTSINFNWLKIDYILNILIKYVKSTYFSLWYIFLLAGQYTSFGECGSICRENTVSCSSLLQFCTLCRKNYGGECFNIEGQTFICSCENGEKY